MHKLQRTLEKAVGLIEQRRFAEARPLAKEVAKKAPEHPLAWGLLGIIASEENLHDGAIGFFLKATKSAPRDAGFQNNLGEAYRKAGRPDEATKRYQEALRLKPNMVSAHANLGLAFEQSNRFDEALESARKALSLRPEAARFHANLATLYQKRLRVEDALASFRRAIQLEPEMASAGLSSGGKALDAATASEIFMFSVL